jgi:secreted trypsin-like serine protease
MFTTVNGTIVLVGLTSYGHGCADVNEPGVYTRISASTVSSFINANL